ncbi:tRNA acetyltransferase TAN1 [Nematocida major]|uniref:tRNA acetyltransferase TAN1 n=1 Tax=Nematocida major TaxID=1912982 RepID=UPI0020085418|nr:tRNA acetyltransferase TAN1 [Nematocida major]KAH9386685.1 tRNA acetyltransferase TAN1 [Nematocida major]
MGGFVVTCVDGRHRDAVREIFPILKMAAFQVQITKEFIPEIVSAEDVHSQLKKERKEARMPEFVLVEEKSESEVLFIRNNSGLDEIEIYNMVVESTKRSECIRRIIPVLSIFVLRTENLARETKKACDKISAQESFRISLSKRLSSRLSSEQIITTVAEGIPRKVDLKSPDKVVMVEVLKDICAIGTLRPCPGNFNITRNPRLQ